MAKRKEQEPSTYLGKLIAHEERRHAYRLAEIKKMSTKLIMLEPVAKALEAKGIRLTLDSLLEVYSKSALYLSTGIFDDKNPRLYNALIDLGFQEVERNSVTIYEQATLKKGRLQVVVNIPNAHQYMGGGAA